MSQEDRNLLLKDLCGRLPYGVKAHGPNKADDTIWTLDYDSNVNVLVHVGWRPYLRPMTSMTEEEDKDFAMLQTDFYVDGWLYPIAAVNMVNWLNAHHFDYRGLIEKGLALEAPEGMYKKD